MHFAVSPCHQWNRQQALLRGQAVGRSHSRAAISASAHSTHSLLLQLAAWNGILFLLLNSNYSLVTRNSRGLQEERAGKSYHNPYELGLIVEMVKSLINWGIKPQQIGIIALCTSAAKQHCVT